MKKAVTEIKRTFAKISFELKYRKKVISIKETEPDHFRTKTQDGKFYYYYYHSFIRI